MAGFKAEVDNQTYYDNFATSYEDRRHGGYHLMIDDLESELVINAARGKQALEVGCGTGLILSRVDEVAERARGIDLSEGMLEHAKKRGLEVQQASATELPFDDETFDVTYSFKVLAHVPDLPLALSEMGRVTKPGGRCFIELYNKQSLRYLLRRLRGGHKVGTGAFHDDQVFVKFHHPSEMLDALPTTLRHVKFHGVRIFTVMPAAVSWPVVGSVLKRAERMSMSSPIARAGGFLVMECERV